MRQDAVVGVDIGGTKTRVVIARAGQVLADDSIPTSAWRVGTNPDGASDLLGRVTRLAGSAAPAALAVGAHGCDSAAECRAFEQRLASLTPMSVRVVNDAELIVPACGLEYGIGVVVGTGSIAVARLEDGTTLAAGGWGWILGDEGSAPSLVREAARAVRRAADAAEPRDPLHGALLATLGISSVTEIGRTLDRLRTAAAVGAHAGAVFRAAEAGSALAREIIGAAARSLTRLVRDVVHRGARAEHVVAAGGVIEAQPTLFAAFEDEMGRTFPKATVRLLQKPPVLGAVALAERLLDERRATRSLDQEGLPSSSSR